MFCLLAKDDFNTNTANTINTFLFPLPHLSLSLLGGWQLFRPRGLRVTVMTVAALLLRKLWRGTNEQMNTQSVNVSLSWSTNQTSLLAASSCAKREEEEGTEREEQRRTRDCRRGGSDHFITTLNKFYIIHHHELCFFFFWESDGAILETFIIVKKLHRVYHGNIIYPFRVYPNRFIYLCGRVGWEIMLLFFQMYKLSVFFSFLLSLKHFSLMELIHVMYGVGRDKFASFAMKCFWGCAADFLLLFATL